MTLRTLAAIVGLAYERREPPVAIVLPARLDLCHEPDRIDRAIRASLRRSEREHAAGNRLGAVRA